MVETISSSSSTSSCASLTSFDDVTVKNHSNAVKFLCSYGGKILPRYPDGKLRYFGGDTRVLSVDQSIPYSELLAKMGDLCGWAKISLRCKLPTEDLDALVSITSDEDLKSLIEEYNLAGRDVPSKIRAFLYEVSSSPKKSKTPSPPRMSMPSSSSPPSPPRLYGCQGHHQISRFAGQRDAEQHHYYHHHNRRYEGFGKNQGYLVHH